MLSTIEDISKLINDPMFNCIYSHRIENSEFEIVLQILVDNNWYSMIINNIIYDELIKIVKLSNKFFINLGDKLLLSIINMSNVKKTHGLDCVEFVNNEKIFFLADFTIALKYQIRDYKIHKLLTI